MKFDFDISAGFLRRKKLRNDLEKSRLRLQYNFPDSTISIIEEKGLFNSTFHITGINLPDRERVVNLINAWVARIKSLGDDQ